MSEGPNRIDYQETPDITEVHAAVQREKAEPSADVTPMPLWLTGVCAFATVWAGIYFGIFHGGLSGDVYNEYESSPAVLFPLPTTNGAGRNVAAATEKTLAQIGKEVFSGCAACHQPSGVGAPRPIPVAGRIGLGGRFGKAARRDRVEGASGSDFGQWKALPDGSGHAAMGNVALTEEDRSGSYLYPPGMGQQSS